MESLIFQHETRIHEPGDILAPYLEIEGIVSAALVSHEGLLVTSRGADDLNLEALAAYIASVMASAHRLASELTAGRPKSSHLELIAARPGSMTPLGPDVFLLLVGR